MRIRNLILCLFVAMFAVAAWTEKASAQCWNCKPDRCMWRGPMRHEQGGRL